ncbi:hypothetical protein N7540_008273 [Penicillium herquei]|nr:hypothetical protein N7540_008273 [Penicillium herquei]
MERPESVIHVRPHDIHVTLFTTRKLTFETWKSHSDDAPAAWTTLYRRNIYQDPSKLNLPLGSAQLPRKTGYHLHLTWAKRTVFVHTSTFLAAPTRRQKSTLSTFPV